jgi:hypothetical protein
MLNLFKCSLFKIDFNFMERKAPEMRPTRRGFLIMAAARSLQAMDLARDLGVKF